MEKKSLLISICCIFFTATSFSESGGIVMEKSSNFFKCLIEKSNKSIEEKKKVIEQFSSESSKNGTQKRVEAMDKICTTEELKKIAEKVECFSNTCKETPSGFLLEQKMESIMIICKDDLLYPSLSNTCRDILPFGSPREKK